MPNPWDDQCIEENLATIAGLQPGQKLGLLKKGEGEGPYKNLAGSRGLRERFTIQSGKIGGLLRARKGESMKDDRRGLDPLVKFFQEAVYAYAASDIDGGLLIGAADGLQVLRDTYRKAGSSDERNTCDRLVDRVYAMLPLELRSIVIRHGSQTVDLLTSPNFVPIRNSLKGFATGFTEEAALEHDDSAAATAIFGATKPTGKATTLPGPPHAYRRRAAGFCQTFARDFLSGANELRYGGQRMTNDVSGIRALHTYLGGDDAMLFLASQLASQAGLPGLFTEIANYRTRENARAKREQCLFTAGTTQFSPAAYKTPALNINKQGNGFRIGCDCEAETSMPILQQMDHNPNQAGATSTLLSSLGVTSMAATFEVVVSRTGDAIGLAMSKARFDITARPRSGSSSAMTEDDEDEEG